MTRFSTFGLRRFGIFLLSLFGASVILFVLLRLLPGTAAQIRLGTEATPRMVEELRRQLGLNRPVWEQYASWIGGLLHGDFGRSQLSGVALGGVIAQKLTVTLPLLACSTVIAVVGATVFGILAAVGRRTYYGSLLSGASQIGIAIPSFWLGILLITMFAVHWNLLPAGGFPDAGWSDPTGSLKSLILPSVTLGVGQAAILMRYVRSSVIEAMQFDFMRTARSKGLSRGAAIRRHALRTAAVPIVTIVGLQITNLLIGTVVVEGVFGYPGLGMFLLQSVANRDLTAVQDTVMLLVAAVLLVNFATDMTYQVIDPRLRAPA